MIKRIVVFLLLLLVSQNSFADNMTCGITKYKALYEPINYTCSSGQFLPANRIQCVSCPAGATCPGGTYSFNENKFQGLNLSSIVGTTNNVCANNLPQRMTAIYELIQYNCAAGQYLPANTESCVQCPANSYCPGGTYTFDASATQGITACGAGSYSPAGARESAQCGHILHVGNEIVYLRATKITSPALHVKIGDDIFYGNMTTADVVMHAGSEHKMYVQYNNQTYSVYDDTVTVP